LHWRRRSEVDPISFPGVFSVDDEPPHGPFFASIVSQFSEAFSAKSITGI
jgi:hypothetical protein